MLEDTVGKRVVLGVETAGKTRDAVVRPVSSVQRLLVCCTGSGWKSGVRWWTG